MARTTTPPTPATLPAVPDSSSWEQVATREVSKALLYFPPWLVGVLLFGLGAAFHFTLASDDPQTIAWTTALIMTCVLVLTALTWRQSHARSLTGRAHTTLTTLAGGLWVCAATINGPASTVTGRLILIGGVAFALSFNIRTVIRTKQIDVGGAAADPLAFLFGRGAEKAGMPTVQARTIQASAHKVTGEVQLAEGRQIADDLQKKVPYVESGIGLPPGSIVTSVDPDDASKAKVVISDPRVMKQPVPWPGPSRVGASIAAPVRPGLWQDLDDVAYVIVGHHVQIMGKTGSGKSIGGAWNLLAEIVTRSDVAVFAIDITKGEQTLGPLKAALHRLETTSQGAKDLLTEMQAKIKPRTDLLSGKGLQKWAEGCGLTYWVLWLEEFPDIYDALTDKQQEQFLSLIKAIRSAGGTVVLSLQRSDWTQMPTIARGQLAKMCFGVDSAADATFGLSEAQEDAGCRPELWSNKQPGMAYLDAPSIPDDRITMPMRTYAWGMSAAGAFDDERAHEQMRAHAAAFPAIHKQIDPMTAALSRLAASALAAPAPLPALNDGTAADPADDDPDDDEEVRNVAGEYLNTDDPDPEVTVDLDDEISDFPEGEPPLTFAPPEPKMTPEQRGAALMDRLHELWDDGARDVGTGDFKVLWETTDISRAWFQKQMRRLSEAGVIGAYDDDRQRYLMEHRPELP
ncbi:hypothetical protein [Nonomuraea diastatica]|uniref:hypothetical protein n=1 Tax=Nonomuraea diastatica TaxID=1848329 RepID=UPI00140D929A|nr:hypothetical protein [Nonomuraea diastatica]